MLTTRETVYAVLAELTYSCSSKRTAAKSNFIMKRVLVHVMITATLLLTLTGVLLCVTAYKVTHRHTMTPIYVYHDITIKYSITDIGWQNLCRCSS